MKHRRQKHASLTKGHDVVKRQYETSFSSFLTSTNSRARWGVVSRTCCAATNWGGTHERHLILNVETRNKENRPDSRDTNLFFTTYTQSTKKGQNDTKFSFLWAFSWTAVCLAFLFILTSRDFKWGALERTSSLSQWKVGVQPRSPKPVMMPLPERSSRRSMPTKPSIAMRPFLYAHARAHTHTGTHTHNTHKNRLSYYESPAASDTRNFRV